MKRDSEIYIKTYFTGYICDSDDIILPVSDSLSTYELGCISSDDYDEKNPDIPVNYINSSKVRKYYLSLVCYYQG